MIAVAYPENRNANVRHRTVIQVQVKKILFEVSTRGYGHVRMLLEKEAWGRRVEFMARKYENKHPLYGSGVNTSGYKIGCTDYESAIINNCMLYRC